MKYFCQVAAELLQGHLQGSSMGLEKVMSKWEGSALMSVFYVYEVMVVVVSSQ